MPFVAFEHKSPLVSFAFNDKRFYVYQLQLNLPLREILRQRQEDGGFIDPHQRSPQGPKFFPIKPISSSALDACQDV